MAAAAAPAKEPLKVIVELDVDNTLVQPGDRLNEELITFLLQLQEKLLKIGIEVEFHLFTARTPTRSIRYLTFLGSDKPTIEAAIVAQEQSPALLSNLVDILKKRGLKIAEDKPVIQAYDGLPDVKLGTTFDKFFKFFEEKLKAGLLKPLMQFLQHKSKEELEAEFNQNLNRIAWPALVKASEKPGYEIKDFIEQVKIYTKAVKPELDEEHITEFLRAWHSFFVAAFSEITTNNKLIAVGIGVGEKQRILAKVLDECTPNTLVIWIDDDRSSYDAAFEKNMANVKQQVAFVHQRIDYRMTVAEYFHAVKVAIVSLENDRFKEVIEALPIVFSRSRSSTVDGPLGSMLGSAAGATTTTVADVMMNGTGVPAAAA
jgi:hypothetical protein